MAFNTQAGLNFAIITVIISVASLMLSCLLNGRNGANKDNGIVARVGAGVDRALICSFDSIFSSTLLTSYAIQFLISFLAGGYLYGPVSAWVSRQS